MMDEKPGPPRRGDQDGGYPVPPQFPAPPDAAGPAKPGPPVVAPEDPAAALWGPAAEAQAEPDRWSAPPPHRYGGTALLDRPTVARRPVVAPPVRPLPPPPPGQGWDWERSHGLRNALVAAAAILLVGSLLAAFLIFRDRDDKNRAVTEPPPATPGGPAIDPTANGGVTATTGVPGAGGAGGGGGGGGGPVSLVPVTPATTTAPTPATIAAPPRTAAPTTQAPTTVTTQRPTPSVTASPPYTGGPIPTKPTTTIPSTTSSTRRTG